MRLLKKAWLNTLLAPIWFVLAIIILSIYVGSTGVANDKIASHVEQMTNLVLAFALSAMLFMLHISKLIKTPSGIIFHHDWQKALPDLVAGLVTGLALLGLYILVIMPIHHGLQQTFGDYVPVGATTHSFSQYPLFFFMANVLLAPFVEEKLYRGVTLDAFQQKYGVAIAIMLSSILFGLLHWLGGFWYMLITALVIGVPFAVIAIKRGNLYWVFSAHFSLNIGEFLYFTQLN